MVAKRPYETEAPRRLIVALTGASGSIFGVRLLQKLRDTDIETHLMNNVFFDTCVYHQPGIDLLADVIDNKNILFGSEMVGAVRGIDPETGDYFDDTKRYVDALPIPEADKRKVFELNARRVYPRLDERLQK